LKLTKTIAGSHNGDWTTLRRLILSGNKGITTKRCSQDVMRLEV
jgi:hypothetical protein